MAKTIGQQLQNLDKLSGDEVKVADEKHTLSLVDKPEELRIVLTRPLTVCRSKEIKKVGHHAFLKNEPNHACIQETSGPGIFTASLVRLMGPISKNS